MQELNFPKHWAVQYMGESDDVRFRKHLYRIRVDSFHFMLAYNGTSFYVYTWLSEGEFAGTKGRAWLADFDQLINFVNREITLPVHRTHKTDWLGTDEI